MNLEHFVKEMKKLQAKYGDKKISKKLAQDVWDKLKLKEDWVITERVGVLMITKSVHGDKFELDDFLLDQDKPEPVKAEKDITPKVVRRTAPPAWQPPPEPTMTDGALKKELDKLGAKDLVEAVAKVRSKNASR